MSSREPLWYCHECHAEMRPLMVPDPHCASCNGTFVEKLENTDDDPRQFAGGAGDIDDPFSEGGGSLLFGLHNLLRGMGPQPIGRSVSSPGAAPTSPGAGRGGGQYTLRIDRTSTPGGGARTTFSSQPLRSDRSDEPPRLSEYVSRNSPTRPGFPPEDEAINGPLMFHYLLSMLQQQPGGRRGPMADFFGGMLPPGAESGRMGDYVFNQQALDEIITQIMENSSSHPVPATEEIMNKLDRDVLEEGSPLLEKDCAVCKDQFQLGTEDPDEQVVVTLPCKHPFHEPCIVPWLKSSGTCPVCRYQLVPQPEHHTPGPGPPGGSNGPRSPGNGNGTGTTGGYPQGGFLGNLVNMLSSGGAPGAGSNSTSPGNDNRPRQQSNSSRHDEHDIPGGWNDGEVD
ncbi:hypothetical protein BDW22DRAFT_1480109 [Trametopsis cervina]|nr:hypothetical protein BDW22DRAFT_1480109 [Trametopsis cervina]